MKKFSRIYIEISNICNLQCDFCPEVERNKKIMSQEVFEKIIDQAKDLTEEVTFHLMGEPLAHSKFTEFIEYCAKVNMPVNITTNGTLLNRDGRVEALLNPIVRQVNFSLQSWSSNFPNKDLKEFFDPVFRFTKLALERRPDLYINYRLWNVGSAEETERANQHFLQPILQEFGFTNLSGQIDVAFRKSRRIKNRLYLHFDSRFVWPSLKNAISGDKGFCYGLKSHIGIHADGTIVPCCLDKEANIDLGKVTDAVSILEAINSERAKRIRNGFDNFKMTEELCRRCSFIRRFDKKMARK